jgi:hypothetical protein
MTAATRDVQQDGQGRPGYRLDIAVEGGACLGDQHVPAEGPEVETGSNTLGTVEGQGLQATWHGLVQAGQQRCLGRSRLDSCGLQGQAAVRPHCDDRLGGTAHYGPCKGFDPCLGSRDHVRPVGHLVFDQQVPLALGVLLQFEGLEVQELGGNLGDSPGSHEITGNAGQHNGDDQDGQYDQDKLYAYVHNSSIDGIVHGSTVSLHQSGRLHEELF